MRKSKCLECPISAGDAMCMLLDDDELMREVFALKEKLRARLEGVDATCVRLEVQKNGWDVGFHFFANS